MDALLTFVFDNWVPIAVAAGGLVAVLLLWWVTILATKLSARRAARRSLLPRGLTLVAQPFMSPGEAAFYNVLRLAVQDEYLLFAQVPLWCLVEMQAARPDLRSSFLRQIALKRVDFVLVHPGSLTVAKVVELDDPENTSPQRQLRNRLVEETLRAARIEIVRLRAGAVYTIAELAHALDIEPAE